jgi:hypothetical protein
VRQDSAFLANKNREQRRESDMILSLDLSTLPVGVLIAGGVVVLAQIIFELWALIDMLRRPADQLTLGGRKWLWAIIIVVVNWIGAIVYFIAGRKPPAVDEGQGQADQMHEQAQVVADVLYGPGANKDGS